MAFCNNCGAQLSDGNVFCAACGAPVNANQTHQQNASQQNTAAQQTFVPYVDPKDHTADYASDDISRGKIFAMVSYLLGFIGIIITYLAAKDSEYAIFHARQALKIAILNTLISICSIVLAITIIVPLAGAVCSIILLVIEVICFFQVCAGKAKEAPIVSSFTFFD